MEKTIEYPFIFIYNGKPLDIYSFQGEKYFVFSFKDTVKENEIIKIEKLIPGILNGNFLWSDKMMMNYSVSEEDEIIMYYMKKRRQGFDAEMDEDIMLELYTDFANEIEEWAVKVNEIAPVDFFIGNSGIAGSKWDEYSNTMLADVILKLESASNEPGLKSKQIINTALDKIRECKSGYLSKEIILKADELIKLTE